MTDKNLDPKKLPSKIQTLADKLNAKVIGQERAIKHLIKSYVPMTVNLHREGRPMGVFLFLGPTGVGKTELVRTFAKTLLGSRDAITRVDCAEFGESHEVSKLLGAPPGYVGFNDKPALTQEKIDKHQLKTPEGKVNVILFDEIEKAHARLFDAIMDDSVYKMSKEAAKKQFRPEFINRLDSMVVFRSLSRESLQKILSIELDELQWRIWKSPWRDFGGLASGEKLPEGRSIIFRLTEAARNFVLDEGTSEIYGARELNRAIDKFLAFPLATLIASDQLMSGDRVQVDHKCGEKDLTFRKMDRL